MEIYLLKTNISTFLRSPKMNKHKTVKRVIYFDTYLSDIQSEENAELNKTNVFLLYDKNICYIDIYVYLYHIQLFTVTRK